MRQELKIEKVSTIQKIRDFHKSKVRAPYRVIVWRTIWWVPMLVTKSFFLGVVAIGWGPKTALAINRAL